MVKRVLLGSLAALTLVALALAATGYALYSRAQVSTVGELRFENELKVPPLLAPRLDADGRRAFDLRLLAGTSELQSGKTSETWGVNGSYLGPTLRAARGDEVLINVLNMLPERTTLHWHGMHLPAAADGGPHQMIEPGTTWSPSWEIDQPAATLWYHPHPHGETANHVYRGVAGMIIVDDPEGEGVPLPNEYGVDDVPLIIQDKRFEDDGSLELSNRLISPTGLLGDEILINGTSDPHLEIGHERVRLRLLNASNARIYDVGFADEREFHLIGTDGGLLEAPQLLRRIQLSPGERAEMVAAFQPGEQVILRSFEPELGTNFFENRFAGGDDSFDLLQVRAAPTLRPSPEVPERLAAREGYDVEDAVRTRRFELSGVSINDKRMDMSRIDEVIEADTTEIWEVHNASGTPHSFHPHGVSFRILEHAGGPPPRHLRGLKDTVDVPPGKSVRLVVRFGTNMDPRLPYMFHCHILQHEDRGMMGQFLVKPPQAVNAPAAAAAVQHVWRRRLQATRLTSRG